MRGFPFKHIEDLNVYLWYASYFAWVYRGENYTNSFMFHCWDVFIIPQSKVMQVGIDFAKNNKPKCNVNT